MRCVFGLASTETGRHQAIHWEKDGEEADSGRLEDGGGDVLFDGVSSGDEREGIKRETREVVVE